MSDQRQCCELEYGFSSLGRQPTKTGRRHARELTKRPIEILGASITDPPRDRLDLVITHPPQGFDQTNRPLVLWNRHAELMPEFPREARRRGAELACERRQCDRRRVALTQLSSGAHRGGRRVGAEELH